MKTLNVIGCGKVGKALARLFSRHRVFEVRSILNRSLTSAREAAAFVGQGEPIESVSQMRRADVVMIAAADEAIADCCEQLSAAGVIDEGVIVFHCSGAVSSGVLAPAARLGAFVASVHPVKSFADPAVAERTFAGTFCAVEGNAPACEVLAEAFGRCGATCFNVDPARKRIYHAAMVIMCNYLVALLEAGLRCLEEAGVDRDRGLEMVKPIVDETVRNVFDLGPVRALTGPIARGEASVVAGQCEALGAWSADIERIYKALGPLAAELAAQQGSASPDSLAEIERMLLA